MEKFNKEVESVRLIGLEGPHLPANRYTLGSNVGGITIYLCLARTATTDRRQNYSLMLRCSIRVISIRCR